MEKIKLKPVDATEKIFLRLEKMGLIRTLRPTAKILRRVSGNGLVDTLYSSPAAYGTHKLICVRSDNAGRIALNSHPHNEEFILINNTGLKLKPLLMVVGLHRHKEMEEKIRTRALSSADFLFLRLKYNDHKTCFFTMLKDTPHCEMSEQGKGRPSIFFVSEPSNLPMRDLHMGDYSFSF